ncbi:DUF2950 domain-containing protein [Variovorax dokdonensis]|uniref:DUF2950 domain-containing protein n=1 Tax=Variovorax dokdonensis TaxID=344883 RepID=A0ABT7NGK3_9BURK|nr:DUF2950 domain-containing protein [Variovorax dokdonensis]MDM0047087.1 DUF2950 domain-containing protein [Variovorax dokdonensis]
MNLNPITGRSTMQLKQRTLAAAAIAAMALVWLPAAAQHVYDTPQAAADAFANAIATNDEAALRTVLGNDWRRFVPADEIDREDIYAFLEAWSHKHGVVPAGEGRMLLAAGEGNWTMAVPIVKVGGGWRFDPRAGADMMKTRRIGRNELSAMQAVLAYVDAQREYSRVDHDGNGVLEYAQKFASSPGKRDGLYWPQEPGQPLSPLGPAFAPDKPGAGYHGYRFKILKAQGPGADGGARSYLIGSRMRSGFALVAWPVRYGETGVMSFIVNQDGVVYEKDLGSGTDAAARAMTRFDPSGGWRKAQVPDQ